MKYSFDKKAFDTIIETIEGAKSIGIYMHASPDGDCIGSALALYLFLKKLGKKATVFSPDLKTKDMYSMKYYTLGGFDDINKTDIKQFDLNIGVDLGDENRLGDAAKAQFYLSPKSIVFDHHASHVDFAKTITYRESTSVSTTQILYKFMMYYKPEFMDVDIASNLYIGLITDSGLFSYETTSSETFQVASDIKGYGVNIDNLSRVFFKEQTKEVFELKNRVFSKAKFFENDRIVFIVYTKEDFKATNTTENNTEGIISSLIEIKNVDIAISISEIASRKYKVSIRSKGACLSSNIAQKFGGGGHARAAGCRICGTLQYVTDTLINAAKEEMNGH